AAIPSSSVSAQPRRFHKPVSSAAYPSRCPPATLGLTSRSYSRDLGFGQSLFFRTSLVERSRRACRRDLFGGIASDAAEPGSWFRSKPLLSHERVERSRRASRRDPFGGVAGDSAAPGASFRSNGLALLRMWASGGRRSRFW